ncbi:crotonase/enoyl-CoA hydratase family protein [Caulobacter sp. B11]|uniref:crotonase/enoyl-CoA hydratase family protein n=1 Tax=Caulobacter sp. B11 TaxID=2048899 RepID=UPI001F010AEC|nr:crotonase/enoyl-CoA hydratase family protein [Caulobacter sp. B11]
MNPVTVEPDGPVWTVTINRPAKRNAVDPATALQLNAAFDAFEADATAAVAILTGANGTFCAGFDLAVAAEGAGERYDPDGEGPMGPTRRLLSKPVIAAVEGHAVAGGLELALWCDLRVAAQSAVFGVFCRRWGVPLIDGGTVRLPRIVGQGRALDMILTGRPVSAAEALSWGLADRVVADGSALVEAQALAAQIAAFRRSACAPTAPRLLASGMRAWRRRSPPRRMADWSPCAARPGRARRGSVTARGAGGRSRLRRDRKGAILYHSASPAKAGAQIQLERLGMMRLVTQPRSLASRGSIWAPAFAGETVR